MKSGQGVAPDYALTAAVTWYRRVAAQGYRPAQVNLGVLSFAGRVVRRDLGQAYKWFALAGSEENRDTSPIACRNNKSSRRKA